MLHLASQSVVASEAKQSRWPQGAHVLWIASSLTLLAMTTGFSRCQDALASSTNRAATACPSAPAVHQASVARIIQPRALALETRLLRLRHRPELPEAKEKHRSKGEQHLDDAIIFLVHARSAFEAFRTLETFEDAEHTDEGFAPAHDRARGPPRNGPAASRGFNEKVRASQRRRRACFRQRERPALSLGPA